MKSVLAPLIEMVKSTLFPFYQVELHCHAYHTLIVFFLFYIYMYLYDRGGKDNYGE